jgi:hypothetical protein
VTAVGKPESSVKRRLRIMRDRLITATDAGKAARYVFPEHLTDSTGDGHEQ